MITVEHRTLTESEQQFLRDRRQPGGSPAGLAGNIGCLAVAGLVGLTMGAFGVGAATIAVWAIIVGLGSSSASHGWIMVVVSVPLGALAVWLLRASGGVLGAGVMEVVDARRGRASERRIAAGDRSGEDEASAIARALHGEVEVEVVEIRARRAASLVSHDEDVVLLEGEDGVYVSERFATVDTELFDQPEYAGMVRVIRLLGQAAVLAYLADDASPRIPVVHAYSIDEWDDDADPDLAVMGVPEAGLHEGRTLEDLLGECLACPKCLQTIGHVGIPVCPECGERLMPTPADGPAS